MTTNDSPPSAPAPDTAAGNALARRWLLNLALLLVIAGLGFYAWYHSRHVADETKPLLTRVDPEAVRKIEIEHTGQPIVKLERHDGDWRLSAPLAARADSFAVESLLRVLRAPIEGTVTPADADLARYGLAPTALVARFDNTEIRFGEMHPLKDESYVQVGSALHLIASQYRAQLGAPYTNLIDSRLIESGSKPVGFKLPGFALTLKDGTWQREPPIAALSSDRINAFVDDWLHARALQVEKYSAKKTEERVVGTFQRADGAKTELSFDILARKPELILYRPDEGLEYHFPEDTAQRLLYLNAEDEKPNGTPATPANNHAGGSKKK